MENKIMMDSNNGNPAFSVDLLSDAKKHIYFLQSLHSLGVTVSAPTTESLRRYRDLWLVLVHENQDEDLVPPPDVAWLWHCHRLAPYRYESYLQHRFGNECPLLEARPPFAFQLEEFDKISPAAAHTKSLWEERHPKEPFLLLDHLLLEQRRSENDNTKQQDDSSTTSSSNDKEDHEWILCGFDLLGSTERQATFLWQVSGPQFQDAEFLKQGVGNYHKFLELRKHAPTQIIVPTYQIDLMWHTHMLSNMKGYYEDCVAILGKTLHHDDSLNDRTEGGKLDTAFRATKALWHEQYQEDYHMPGGMYRGEPPMEFYKSEWAVSSKQHRDEHGHHPPPPLGPFLQLVGIHGASSTSSTGEWTNVKGNDPNGNPGFVSPSARSTTRGVNANPSKDNYIFGPGTQGIGYYHVTTKEAYQILLTRMDRRIMEVDNDIASHICCNTFFSCGLGNAQNSPYVQTQERHRADLTEMREVVKARSLADFPIGMVGIPDIPDTSAVRGTDAERSNPTRNQYYDSGGYWLFPKTFYTAGGGCGATGAAGGGCGGAGGCGAGGCGGGGCGGGGCGGGGGGCGG